MTLKKFYAPSINEAHEKAQDALGQTYIVVETKEATNDEPAWIHVLDDRRDAGKNSDVATYSRRDLFPKALTKLKETVNDSLQLFNAGDAGGHTHDSKSTVSKSTTQYQTEAPNPSTRYTNEPQPPSGIKEQLHFEKGFKTLNERFDQVEKFVSKQTFGANAKIISHPAFQQLLANGVPYATICGWFNEILGRGWDPYYQKERFMPLLAQKVKQTLNIAAENDPAPYMLFTGTPGSGKSSLIMKLILHSTILQNRTCAVVSVSLPGKNHFYSPLESFATEYNIAYYELKDNRSLSGWKEEWSKFDHVLIEMPGTELQATPDGFSAKTFQKIFSSENLLETHYVINATLNPACLDRHPIFNGRSQTGYLDFTHLDGTPEKGHLLPFMQKSGCKVRYVASGPEIPDDIATFKPARFARQLLTNI